MVEKFFTPREANQLLPRIKIIVKDILAKAQELRQLMSTPIVDDSSQKRLMALDHDIKQLMGALEDAGCLYKDWNFEIGLVDFPAIIHGQEALLCWRSDEPQVGWFHGYEDGYAGRQPITKQLIFS